MFRTFQRCELRWRRPGEKQGGKSDAGKESRTLEDRGQMRGKDVEGRGKEAQGGAKIVTHQRLHLKLSFVSCIIVPVGSKQRVRPSWEVTSRAVRQGAVTRNSSYNRRA